ncbi:MAG: helix-turn-helix transcriptional regulator [Anaerolineae bacterium]|nr:helix-turn-helix transcriptional regulator [Anaerolineae bacterium]
MDSNPNPYDVNSLIGARIQAAREAKGVSQRVFAKKIGMSYNKIFTLEQGKTRMLVSDLIEIANGLGISPWTLLQDIPEFTDMRRVLEAWYDDLAGESRVSVDHMLAAQRWIDRYWRIKLRMEYQPMYYVHPQREPIVFFEEWENPVSTDLKKYLYVERKESGFSGYFFKAEIVPSPSPEYTDTPELSDGETWEHETQLREFLAGHGYCWQLYPVRIHHDAYCSEEHRTEIEGQRKEIG